MSFNEYWQAEQRRQAVASALAALPSGGAAAQEQFMKALRGAILLMPVAELPANHELGDVLVGQEVQVKVSLAHGPEGQLFLPLFTSEAALGRSHEAGSPFVQVPFGGMVPMARGINVAGIVLDRGGPHSAVVPMARLEAMVGPQSAPPPGGAAAPNAGGRPTLRVGPPPRVILAREIVALDDWLAGQEGLVQGYLFGLVRPDGRAFLTVGLGFPVAPEPRRVEAMVQGVGTILGASGVVLMDARLATLLARQAGVIRFDLNPPQPAENEAP